jgi:hypothetical protein
MKVSELIAGLEEFQANLAEREELSPERRVLDSASRRQAALEEQSRWLLRRCGALRPYIERFDDQSMMQHPATVVTCGALETAASLRRSPAKKHSIQACSELHQIIGRLHNFDQDEEIAVDPRQQVESGASNLTPRPAASEGRHPGGRRCARIVRPLN